MPVKVTRSAKMFAAVPPLDAPDGDDRAVKRRRPAADHGLQGADHLRGQHHRVNALFRIRAVTALAQDVQAEARRCTRSSRRGRV